MTGFSEIATIHERLFINKNITIKLIIHGFCERPIQEHFFSQT